LLLRLTIHLGLIEEVIPPAYIGFHHLKSGQNIHQQDAFSGPRSTIQALGIKNF